MVVFTPVLRVPERRNGMKVVLGAEAGVGGTESRPSAAIPFQDLALQAYLDALRSDQHCPNLWLSLCSYLRDRPLQQPTPPTRAGGRTDHPCPPEHLLCTGLWEWFCWQDQRASLLPKPLSLPDFGPLLGLTVLRSFLLLSGSCHTPGRPSSLPTSAAFCHLLLS